MMNEQDPAESLFRGMTRREALNTLARTGAAALPLGWAARLGAQQSPPGAASTVEIVNGTPAYRTGRPVLKPSDLRFLGFYRFPTNMDMMSGTAFPTIAFRRVGGQARVFVWGGPRTDFTDYSMWEVSLPDNPSPNVRTAPMGTTVREWGNIARGYANADGTGGVFPSGLLYDETRNALWWTYAAVYVASYKFPPLACTILNDGAGTARTYGPWRTQFHQNMTLGSLGPIPSAFASQFTQNRVLGMAGAQVAGNANSPFGASLAAHAFPDPTTTAADKYNDDGAYTMASQGLLQHPLDHRQERDTNYKLCRFVRTGNEPYSCTVVGSYGGSTVERGLGLFGSQDTGAGTSDGMSSWAWIDLPDKHGVIYFGQLATTPTGYRAPNDADGMIHRGYASLPGSPPACCHGQDDPFFTSTGPFAHAMMPMGWIYNPNDLAATARGTANLWSRVPTSTFQWRDYVPQMQSPLDNRNIGRFPSGAFGSGSYFDPVSRRLYTSLRFMDDTSGYVRPVVCVWEIA